MDLDPRLARGQASPGSSTPSPSNQLHSRSGGRGGRDEDEASEESPAVMQQDGGDAEGGIDPKKLRACESCRGLKVRCEPDPNEGPCKRCKKAGRNCVVTAPTRKRQKKTDSRVSELEKKIDALTASLQARAAPAAHQSPQSHTQQQQQQHQHQYGSPDVVSSGSGSGAAAAAHNDRARQHSGTMQGNEHRRWNKEIAPWDRRSGPADNDSPFQQLITIAGKKRKAGDDGQEQQQQQQQQQQQNQHQGRVEAQDERAPSTTAAAMGWPAYTSKAADGDVVDRGLVPKEMALELFAKYKAQMVRHLPGIVFPPSTTVAELRKTKPILFLSIMAAASGENHSLQRVLQKELMQIFAEKVIVTGEKSLELVQALTVAVIWYWPPEYFEELKFYQLIHIAAVMALDIGLGRKSPSRGGRGSMGWRENPSRRNPPPDPLSLESRRTWLTCYYLAANTSISLHRPNLIRWTPFMAESMEILETSPDAAPTDKYFCHLVWTHHLGEQISNQFSMDDPSAAVNIADPRTQYALRAFERDLERYIASVPQERMQATLRIGFDLLNLYMHESALQADASTEKLEPPYTESSLNEGIVREEPLSTAHVNALTSCLSAINGIFTTFLNLEVTSIRCLPVFNFVRVAYAVVVLMKMYFSASTAGSELGHVFTRESMRVQYYLDALLDKFRATAADDKCRPASKFLVVLAMLRSWFVKQGKDDAGKKNTSGGGNNAPDNSTPKGNTDNNSGQSQQQHHQQQQTQQPQTANTPLQLLSEVATGRESSFSNNNNNNNNYNYYRAQPQQPYNYTDPTTAAEVSTGMTPLPLGGNGAEEPSSWPITPWIMQAMMSGNDFDAGMGGGGGGGGGGMGGFDVSNAAAGSGSGGFDGMRMTANDQFFSDMFQGLPDDMFGF